MTSISLRGAVIRIIAQPDTTLRIDLQDNQLNPAELVFALETLKREILAGRQNQKFPTPEEMRRMLRP